MWKLFVTVMMFSDTGAVSSNVIVTDYGTRRECETMATMLSMKTEEMVLGHTFAVKVRAMCSQDSMTNASGQPLQPQQFSQQFLDAFGRMLREPR